MNATPCSNYQSSPSPAPQTLVGWVAESSGRGTLGLITTCLTTLFLCTWVVIHPRVYKRELFAILHKLALCLKTILAPELIAVEGLQEWAQCRVMERECASLTKGQFKLIHAFYISMLALRYHTPQGDRVIWPNQYTWLLQQRIIVWEDRSNWGLSEEDIRDKSKSDTVAKLLALTQVFWFVVQCILRATHALPLSQLESMTIAYIPLFAVTYFFWWEKPKDIRSPSIVVLPDMSPQQRHTFDSMALSNKFDREGLKDQVGYWNIWYLTPRVFEKEEEDRAIQEARANAARKVALGAATRNRQGNPKPGDSAEITITECAIPSIEDMQTEMRKEIVLAHWDPHLYRSRWIWPFICFFGVSFPALHLISWNTLFPTFTEMWLWRASVFISIFSMLIFMHFEKVVFRWKGILTIISIAAPGLYFISRVLMMAEGLMTLRAEDSAIYDTYEVSNYWVRLL